MNTKTSDIKKTRQSVDYQNGKIYKIVNSFNDKIYVGSCATYLKNRFSGHKSYASNQTHNKTKTAFYDDLKDNKDKFKIVLIELYPCASKLELEKREYEVINEMINTLGRDKLYNVSLSIKGQGHSSCGNKNCVGRVLTETTKQKISQNKKGKIKGNKHPMFKHGSIYERENRRYIFQWNIYDEINNISHSKSKTFNFNNYGSKENAYNACLEFQKQIYPDIS